MTEIVQRTADDLQAEVVRLREENERLRAELSAYRYAMADFAAELGSCVRRLGGLTSSPPWKDRDSSPEGLRFALHGRAQLRKKASRAATACPAAGTAGRAASAWLSPTGTTYHLALTGGTAFLPDLKAGASRGDEW